MSLHRQSTTEESTPHGDRPSPPVRELLAALLLLCLIVASAAAGPFSQLFVFGDSLSDVGNISQVTASIPDFLVPTTPGPYYYEGRFSDGPVYAEGLAEGLGLPPLVRSLAGGTNFAYGGAKTSGTTFPDNLAVRDVDDQVTDYLASPTNDPNALFVVFAGANDLLDGQTNMSIPVNRLATDIGRLINAGASQFLVANLPLLGYTPRFNGNPTDFALYNARSEQFNTALATMLDGLEASNPAIELYRFDVAALFNQAISNPAAFGLTNVTDPAAPGLEPGDSMYTGQIAANEDEYLFWDELHPTAAVHAILAERALALFALPGDFNHDNVVDAADYIVWRQQMGSAQEYETWRDHFGQTAGGGSLSNASVPEPATRLMLVAGSLAIFFLRRPVASATCRATLQLNAKKS